MYEKNSNEKVSNTFQTDDVIFSPPSTQILWMKIIVFVFLHIFAISGIFMCDSLKHLLYVLALWYMYTLGITAGAHRLWCHKAYKAKFPLRVFLMLMNCGAIQDTIYRWSRDHRLHHKLTETHADPYNSERGFFFCHMGWLFVRKHPAVLEKGKKIDVGDILADPVVKFQTRYYVPLVLTMAIIVPCIIPYFLWNVSLYKSFCMFFCLRYVLSLHGIWSVNSFAHMWGYKPYNPNIHAVENLIVSLFAGGEGFHNYHHTFPWDYSASEFGWNLNFSTLFIDVMAWLGLAYDRKSVPEELVNKFKNKYNPNHISKLARSDVEIKNES